MTEQLNVQQMAERLCAADNILVLCHKNPDGDTIGCGSALCHALKALGKTGLHTRVYESAQDEADWNDGKIDILLAHPASCAYGLNLQRGGHHVIWFGLTWSLELYQQANKRLHRQGQEYPVIVHHLVVRGGVDEDVMKSLSGKERAQESLLAALKVRIDKAHERSQNND